MVCSGVGGLEYQDVLPRHRSVKHYRRVCWIQKCWKLQHKQNNPPHLDPVINLPVGTIVVREIVKEVILAVVVMVVMAMAMAMVMVMVMVAMAMAMVVVVATRREATSGARLDLCDSTKGSGSVCWEMNDLYVQWQKVKVEIKVVPCQHPRVIW